MKMLSLLIFNLLMGVNLGTAQIHIDSRLDYEAGFENAIHFIQAQDSALSLSTSECYNLGVSYLHSKFEKQKATEYLQKAFDEYRLNKNLRDSALLAGYYLGRACQYSYKYIQASETFQFLTDLAPATDTAFIGELNRQKAVCAEAQQLIHSPINISVSQLPAPVNTVYSDHSPLLSADGNTLIFSTTRSGVCGSDIIDYGAYPEDIYVTTLTDSAWTDPQPLNKYINTEAAEIAACLSTDGQELFFVRDGDLFTCRKIGAKWSQPKALPAPINSDADEINASLSGNGRVLYFASNRAGGVGGFDIYKTQRKNGQWSDIEILDSSINTSYNEISPFLHPDNKRLYFSSDGWPGLGGFDVFMADISDSTSSKPRNLGYPLNTPYNETFFTVAAEGKHAYYASMKADGQGLEDIYSIYFQDETESKLTVLVGKVVAPKGYEINRIAVSAIEMSSNKTTNTVVANPADGSFTLLYPSANEHWLVYNAENFFPSMEKTELTTDGKFKIVRRNVQLNPLDNALCREEYKLYFEKDHASLSEENQSMTDILAWFLRENPQMAIDVSAAMGKQQVNMSAKRINSVVERLQTGGIDKSRIYTGITAFSMQAGLVTLTIMDTAFVGQIMLNKQANQVAAKLDKRMRTMRLLGRLSNSAGSNLSKALQEINYPIDVDFEEIPAEPVIEEEHMNLNDVPRIFIIENLHFDTNEYTTTEGAESLQRLAVFLNDNPRAVLEIGGYTDTQGRAGYNKKLAQQRADFVKEKLAGYGVDTALQCKVKNYALSTQLSVNKHPDKSFCWESLQYNRRVEFKLLSPGKDSLVVTQIPVPEELRIPAAFKHTVTVENLTPYIANLQEIISNRLDVEERHVSIVAPERLRVPQNVDSLKKRQQNPTIQPVKNQVLDKMNETSKRKIIVDEDIYIFSIILLTADEQQDPKIFEGLSGVRERKDPYGRYMYYFGEYEEEYAAEDMKNRLMDRFPQAYVFINTYTEIDR